MSLGELLNYPSRSSCLALAIAFLLAASPVVRAAEPTTRPTAAADKVLVLRFEPLNASGGQPWIGASIQRTLFSDLANVAPQRVQIADASTSDLQTALELSRKHESRYVIFGSFVTFDGQLRITGQVLDTLEQRPMGAMKATGQLDDLFQLEDRISSQARRRLGLVARAVGSKPIEGATGDAPRLSALSVPAATSDEYYRAYVAPTASADRQREYESYYYQYPLYPYLNYYYCYFGWGVFPANW